MSKAVAPRSGGSLTVLAALLAVAAILRLSLANYAFWFDEYASLFFADQPFSRLWSEWMVRETNPPLFYSVLRGWILLVGPMDRVMLRVPGIFASLLTITVAYVGVARIYGARAGAAAGVLLAVSAQQIFYAHQLRGYSLFALALTVSFFCLMAIVTANERGERQKRLSWLGFIGGSVAATYLHTTGFLWLPIATIGLIVADSRFIPFWGRDWLRLAAADLAILICSSWALWIVYHQLQVPNDNISWLQYPGFRGSINLYWTTVLLVRDPQGIENGICLLVMVGVLFGFWKTFDRPATRLAAACWMASLVLFFAFSLKQPILSERTLVWMAIFPVTLAAAGLGTLRSSAVYAGSVATLTFLLAVNLFLKYDSFQKEDWEGAVKAVAHDPRGALIVRGEGDGVVALEACKSALRVERCPVPIVTLAAQGVNIWAEGYGPTIPATPSGRLALSAGTQIYIVQRFGGLPLHDLKKAGLLRALPANTVFFQGPYAPPFIEELKRVSCIEKRLLSPTCHHLPTR